MFLVETANKGNMESDTVDISTETNSQTLFNKSDKPYKCTYCPKSFSQSGHLTTHTRTHTGDHPFQCAYCSKTFKDRSNCNTHIRTHTGEKPYKCELCGKTFMFNIQLSRHKKVCVPQDTGSPSGLLKTDNKHDNVLADSYSCSSSLILAECVVGMPVQSSKDVSEISSTSGGVLANTDTLHQDSQPKYDSLHRADLDSQPKYGFEIPTNTIHVAGNKTSSSSSSSSSNFNNQHTEEIKTCSSSNSSSSSSSSSNTTKENLGVSENDQCDKFIYIDESDSPVGTTTSPTTTTSAITTTTSAITTTTSAITTITEEVNSTFDINSTARIVESSSSPSELLAGAGRMSPRHNEHEDLIIEDSISKNAPIPPGHESSISCSVCKESFLHPSELVVHLNSNNCEKSLECKYCGKKFFRLTRLNTHLRTHTGVKPYKCSFCGKDFADRGNLKTHRRLHTGEKPFKCSLCLQQFTFHIQLNRHKQRNCKATKPLGTDQSFPGDYGNNNISPSLSSIELLPPPNVYRNFNNNGDTSLSIPLNTDVVNTCDNFNTENSSSKETNSVSNRSDLTDAGSMNNVVDLTDETTDGDIEEAPNMGSEPLKGTEGNLLLTSEDTSRDNIPKHSLEAPSNFSKECLKQCHFDLSEDYIDPTITTNNDNNDNNNITDYSSLCSGSKLEELLLTCQYCYKSFSKSNELNLHYKTHNKPPPETTFKLNSNPSNTKKPYSCKLCPKSFMQPSHLNAHYRTHTGDKPYSCRFCNKAFSNQSNLNTHTRLHTKVKPFKCAQCGQAFTFHIQLHRHKSKCFVTKGLSVQYPPVEKQHNVAAVFPPAETTTALSNNATATRHFISTVNENKASTENCFIERQSNSCRLPVTMNNSTNTVATGNCEKDYSSNNFTGDKEMVSAVGIIEGFTETNEKWEDSNVSMNGDITDINQSSIVHTIQGNDHSTDDITVTEDSVVEPMLLNKSLHSSDRNGISLQSNTINYHNPASKRLYRCKYCKRNFLRLYLLSKHLQLHNFATGEKMFECTLCKKSFQKAGQLNSHVRTHTGVKPFSCQYCGKAFADRSNLNTHRRTHTGEKPFKCSLCGKAFTFHIQLSRHKRVCKPSLVEIHHHHHHQYQKRSNNTSLILPSQNIAEHVSFTGSSSSLTKQGQAEDVYHNQTESLSFGAANSKEEERNLMNNYEDRNVTSSESDNIILPPRFANNLDEMIKPNSSYNYQNNSRKSLEFNVASKHKFTDSQWDSIMSHSNNNNNNDDDNNSNNPESDILKSPPYSEDQGSMYATLSSYVYNRNSGVSNKNFGTENISHLNLSTQSGRETSSFVQPGVFHNADGDNDAELRTSVSSSVQKSKESLVMNNNSLFPCCYCGKVFKMVTTLAVHIELHTGSKTYECEFCDETFSQFGDLAAHLKLHPQEILFQCEYCDLTFSRDCHLRLHEKTHFQESISQKTLIQKLKAESSFFCSICYRAFPNSYSLDSHLTSHTTGNSYRCQTCKQTFTFLHLFKRHIQECQQLLSQNQDPNLISEPISNQNSLTFYSENVFRKDVLVNKSSQDQTNPVGQFSNTGRISSVPVEYQQVMVDSNNPSVLMSSSELDSTKDLVCNYCNRKFSSYKLFSLHVKSHNVNVSAKNVYRCEVCMKLFFQEFLLERHLKTHHGQGLYNAKRDFKCRFCSKTFQQSSHLKAHIRHHTGDKPFNCQYCTKAFSDRSNLNTHTRTHTGEKPFKCIRCRRAFTFHIQLTRHKRICQASVDEPNSTISSGETQQQQHDDSGLTQPSSFTHSFLESSSIRSISGGLQTSTNDYSESQNLQSNSDISTLPLFINNNNNNVLDSNNLDQTNSLTPSGQYVEDLPGTTTTTTTLARSDSRLCDNILTTTENYSNSSSTNLVSKNYDINSGHVIDCKPEFDIDTNMYLQPNVTIKSEPFPSNDQYLVSPSDVTSNMSGTSIDANISKASNDTENCVRVTNMSESIEEDTKPVILTTAYLEFQNDEL